MQVFDQSILKSEQNSIFGLISKIFDCGAEIIVKFWSRYWPRRAHTTYLDDIRVGRKFLKF